MRILRVIHNPDARATYQGISIQVIALPVRPL